MRVCPGYTLTDATQAAECRNALALPSEVPVTVNFLTYNEACKGMLAWEQFKPGVWSHERQHFLVLKAPEHNPYLVLEPLVGESFSEVNGQIITFHNSTQAVLTAATLSVEPTGNWSRPFWVWESESENVFIELTDPRYYSF